MVKYYKYVKDLISIIEEPFRFPTVFPKIIEIYDNMHKESKCKTSNEVKAIQTSPTEDSYIYTLSFADSKDILEKDVIVIDDRMSIITCIPSSIISLKFNPVERIKIIYENIEFIVKNLNPEISFMQRTFLIRGLEIIPLAVTIYTLNRLFKGYIIDDYKKAGILDSYIDRYDISKLVEYLYNMEDFDINKIAIYASKTCKE